ncbi:branched-chain amino acid transport system substrate-binding protein [Pseudomonas sp. RV120224-01b]|nr:MULTISPECIES: branched-chain amino acid ABC transporter substrate-binding protein [unclassified Pseudomonas]PYG78410.1 branched-chain amino acid transport system substrate-binding protein [Pseudomonas sp. RV120224-01c]PYG82649.1 branched-chain amino acid transport system substrate-binding protein [Pseudomonas sp. RV120224-01b]
MPAKQENFKRSKMIGAISAALLSICASQAHSADPIRIALVGPVTGAVAQYGDMVFMGSKMAIEQINKAGGVNGSELEGVVYDDACDPKQAVAVANKIVNDGIHYVVGHTCSSSTQPASGIYEDEGILMVTPTATSPEITAQGYELVFRTIGLDNMQAPIAARYVADTVKPKAVAVLHDKQQYGEGIASAFRQELLTKGQNVVLFEGLNAGDRDFSSIVTKMKKEGVDFVYYGGYHPELGLLLRQSAEKGLKARFMGPEGAGNKELSAIAGEASEGLLVTLPKTFDQDPKNENLVAEFKEHKQDPTGPFVFPAYAAVQVIADGLKLAGEDDPSKVASAMRANTFDTPAGQLAFDDKGDLKDFSFVVYEWHRDGSKTEVK